MIYVEPTLIVNPALRKGSAVYVRNLKCASTFFYDNLLALGWVTTPYQHIDWSNDFVFAHIIDPVTRRHKGMAEALDYFGLLEEYLQSTKWQSALTSCMFLEQHSMPYSLLFPDHLDDIHWIPLAAGQKENILLTQDILHKHCGIKINFEDWNLDFQHISDSTGLKKMVENRLTEQWELNICSYENEVNIHWAIFYEKIKDPDWPDCPPAENFHLLPSEVQHEITTEHSCQGSNLKFVKENSRWYVQLVCDPDEWYDPDTGWPCGPDYTRLGVYPKTRVTGSHYTALKPDIELYQRVLRKFKNNADKYLHVDLTSSP